MSEIATAIGLVLVLEGALYALFPGFMRRVAEYALQSNGDSLRVAGVVSAVLGVVLVWWARG